MKTLVLLALLLVGCGEIYGQTSWGRWGSHPDTVFVGDTTNPYDDPALDVTTQEVGDAEIFPDTVYLVYSYDVGGSKPRTDTVRSWNGRWEVGKIYTTQSGWPLLLKRNDYGVEYFQYLYKLPRVHELNIRRKPEKGRR